MCTEKGIFIIEADTLEISPIEEAIFTDDISKKEFDFLSIGQFEEEDKFIIITYKTLIYIFTSDGEYYTKVDIEFSPQGCYYTLVSYNAYLFLQRQKNIISL